MSVLYHRWLFLIDLTAIFNPDSLIAGKGNLYVALHIVIEPFLTHGPRTSKGPLIPVNVALRFILRRYKYLKLHGVI